MSLSISRRSILKSIATLAIFIAPGAVAQAQSSPALVITRPGVYFLSRDIVVASGDAITINASGVTLDLGGHTVSTGASGTGNGILVNSQKGVKISNGKVGAFNVNVSLNNAENVTVEDLQIVGEGLAPTGGPTEIGILLVGVRGSKIKGNTLTSVNLGIFVRGGASGGNRVAENTITGGSNASYNLLGICYNPLPGGVNTDPGPKGDLVYNNHISRFLNGASFNFGSKGNIFRDNSIAYFNNAFSPITSFAPGDTVSDSNITTPISLP